ncbi:MAG: hypothetical protein U1D35_05485 [Paracoccaceae bacterium]|nr:hypothetical protein [Paracoccaceae bacterium]
MVSFSNGQFHKMLRAGLGFALALIGWLATATAQTVSLDASELRVLAQERLEAGDPLRALEFTRALLARDPQDLAALIVQSQILRAIGETKAAKADARAVWSKTRDRHLRYGAAMAMAQALSSEGRRTAAQFWLRRAAEVAPTDDARTIARRDFGYVKSRNPWVFRFDFQVSPSSNINNGSARTSFDFQGFPVILSGDARALSGVEATVGATASYRFAPTATTRTEINLRTLQRKARLSDTAKRQAPLASASDYSFALIEAAIERKYRPPGSRFTYDLGATLGHNWYGGAALSDYLRLEAGAEHKLSARAVAHLGVTVARQWRRDNSDRSADDFGLGFGLVYGLSNKDRLRFNFGVGWTEANSVEIRNQAGFMRLNWEKAEPVAGIGIAAGISAEIKDFDDSRFSVGGRFDKRLGLDLSLGFDQIDYMGFSPQLDLRASRNWSNVGLFDAQDLGISLGVKSSF